MLLDRRQLSAWGRCPGSSLPRAGRSSASALTATGLGARRLGGAGRQPGTQSSRWRWSGQRPRARRRQRSLLLGWGCHGTGHPPALCPMCMGSLRAGEGQASASYHPLQPGPCLAHTGAQGCSNKRHPTNPALQYPPGSSGPSPPFEPFPPFCPMLLSHISTFHSLFFWKEVTYVEGMGRFTPRVALRHSSQCPC